MNHTGTVLIFLLLVPLLAAVLCLLVKGRVWWERLNLAAFAIVAALAVHLGLDVAQHDKVFALQGLLRADGLSDICVPSPVSGLVQESVKIIVGTP